MDQTAPDPTTTAPSASNPDAPTQSPPSYRQRLRYLWITKRWLAIALGAGASMLGLLLLMGIVIVIGQALNNSTESSAQPYASPQLQTKTTHNSDDDEFFASQPLTMVYYSFAQTTNSKNMVQATPTNRETRIIDIGYPDKYDFLTSPDGKWLLRWDSQTLARASAAKPTTFTPIYTTNGQKITSVIWQNDGSSVALVTSQEMTDEQTGDASIKSTISLIPLVTLEPVVVLEDQADYRYRLIALPTTTQLYFALVTTDGIVSNLTRYNTQTKNSEQQITEFNQDNQLTKLSFTHDMKWTYTHTDTQVVRYNLQTLEQETIYTIDKDCGFRKDNLSTIDSISVSPSGEKILIGEDRVPCERQKSPEEDPHADAQNRAGMYTVSSMELIQELYDSPIINLQDSSWSPDESLLWVQVGDSNTYTLDTTTLVLTPIPSPERQSLTKERLFLIGWLKP